MDIRKSLRISMGRLQSKLLLIELRDGGNSHLTPRTISINTRFLIHSMSQKSIPVSSSHLGNTPCDLSTKFIRELPICASVIRSGTATRFWDVLSTDRCLVFRRRYGRNRKDHSHVHKKPHPRPITLDSLGILDNGPVY